MAQAKSYRTRVLVHRVPIETPVRTSFGVMRDRPSLVIGMEDEDGHVGWGEVWCNFPSVGAEHRARLLQTSILPVAAEIGGWDDPGTLWVRLTARFHILALQTGEFGPISQCIAGLDCALHDLAARQRGLPLYKYLQPDAAPKVRIYASGINPDDACRTIQSAEDDGHTAFKLKVGFDPHIDAANLRMARDLLGSDSQLMIDANQGWTLEQALAFSEDIAAAGLAWVEEPLAHDVPDDDWRRLAHAYAAPLAAGENFGNATQFDRLPEARALSILQPDIGKWGGITQSLRIARQANANSLMYCPHWLGGGVGLLASLHVKAATGGSGMAEVDVNPNPMRSTLCSSVISTLNNGIVTLDDSPGIGGIVERLPEMKQNLALDLTSSWTHDTP